MLHAVYDYPHGSECRQLTVPYPRYKPPAPGCGAKDQAWSKGWFICTRPMGHDGPHAAHGFQDRVVATWEDEKEQP